MQLAYDNEIFRVLTGSQLYGTPDTLEDGAAPDRDEIGVCIEPPSHVFGLQTFEQFVYRDAEIRARAAGADVKHAKSQPGDLDLTIYSLRKFCRLVASGNPSLVILLYTPTSAVLKHTVIGQELCSMAPSFTATRTAVRFLHYMHDQKERLMGLRGQKDVNRPDLVDRFGYDTKYAYHVIRLGLQGVEYASTGKITLPMPPRERDLVRVVRRGGFTLTEVVNMCAALEQELDLAIAESPLPATPNIDAIDKFLTWAYRTHWDGFAW